MPLLILSFATEISIQHFNGFQNSYVWEFYGWSVPMILPTKKRLRIWPYYSDFNIQMFNFPTTRTQFRSALRVSSWSVVRPCCHISVEGISAEEGHPTSGRKINEYIYSNSSTFAMQSICYLKRNITITQLLNICGAIALCHPCFTHWRPSSCTFASFSVMRGASMLCIVLVQC